MILKYNKLKSITKGLIGPNIIFPAAYLLFSAKSCPGFSSDAKKVHIGGSYLSLLEETKQANESNGLEGLNEAEGGALGVTALLGRGTVLNLDGCQCGVFVASTTEDAFIIKLPSKEGWMSLCKEGNDPSVLDVHYDVVDDSRIIKVDYAFIRLLCQSLGQSSDIGQYSIEKEAFWRNIEQDASWRDIKFFYKTPVDNGDIFTEDGITSSTECTKELYQKLSSTSSLISSKLSIKVSGTSNRLKELKKIGFLLFKDSSSLVGLVKTMLEGDAEWGTKAAVVENNAYITCPAVLVDDVLQFDASDLDLQVQYDDSILPLENYNITYCYLNDGAYYRLIALEKVKSLLKTDKELYVWELVAPVVENTTTVVPAEQPVNQDGTQSKDETDGDPNRVDDAQVDQTDPISNSPEGEVMQDENHHQTVRTSPMQYTGFKAGSVPPPPPPPPSTASTLPVVNGIPAPPPLLPATNTGPRVNAIPAPPPPPPMPTQKDLNWKSSVNGTGVQHTVVDSGSSLHINTLAPRSGQSVNLGNPGSLTLMGELQKKFAKKQQEQKKEPFSKNSTAEILPKQPVGQNQSAIPLSILSQQGEQVTLKHSDTVPPPSPMLNTNGSVPPPPPPPTNSGPGNNGSFSKEVTGANNSGNQNGNYGGVSLAAINTLKLKEVVPEKPKPENPRDALLAAIRQPQKLRHVETVSKKSDHKEEGWAGILYEALKSRNMGLNAQGESESESESENEGNGDWD